MKCDLNKQVARFLDILYCIRGFAWTKYSWTLLPASMVGYIQQFLRPTEETQMKLVCSSWLRLPIRFPLPSYVLTFSCCVPATEKNRVLRLKPFDPLVSQACELHLKRHSVAMAGSGPETRISMAAFEDSFVDHYDSLTRGPRREAVSRIDVLSAHGSRLIIGHNDQTSRTTLFTLFDIDKGATSQQFTHDQRCSDIRLHEEGLLCMEYQTHQMAIYVAEKDSGKTTYRLTKRIAWTGKAIQDDYFSSLQEPVRSLVRKRKFAGHCSSKNFFYGAFLKHHSMSEEHICCHVQMYDAKSFRLSGVLTLPVPMKNLVAMCANQIHEKEDMFCILTSSMVGTSHLTLYQLKLC